MAIDIKKQVEDLNDFEKYFSSKLPGAEWRDTNNAGINWTGVLEMLGFRRNDESEHRTDLAHDDCIGYLKLGPEKTLKLVVRHYSDGFMCFGNDYKGLEVYACKCVTPVAALKSALSQIPDNDCSK